MRGLFLAILLVTGGCASNPPPNLTPQAVIAWKSHEIQKDLDLLRDVAIDANAQVPPLVSTDTTRLIVTYHQAAITTMHAGLMGWSRLVQSGLEQIVKQLPPEEQARFGPYVSLIRTVLRGVTW